ncbi:MAG: HDIG domain-containing protein [Candidatus Calescibacterium sp.]|nr:HDIG domain-containing protein [Candidatus Calescibacterium sp.]MCX7971913.1 HDIG domain-containing protein [bacterium]MDW8194988.1 HDIG domain-containing protein [Candidatus Calescibacterium sp.]
MQILYKILKTIKETDYGKIKNVLQSLLFCLFIGLLYYVYLVVYFPIKPNIISRLNIILISDYQGYIDEKEYLQKIQDIYKIKEYDIDYEISSRALYDIDSFFNFQFELKRIFDNSQEDLDNFIYKNHKKLEYFKIDLKDFDILRKINIEELEMIKTLILKKLEILYRKGIEEDEVPQVISELDKYLESYIQDFRNNKNLLQYKQNLIIYLSRIIYPNKFLNISKTLERHTEMISKIPRIYNLSKGSVIVKRGQIISDEAYKVILETGTKRHYDLKFIQSAVWSSLFAFLIILSVLFINSSLSLKNIFTLISFLFISSVFVISYDEPFYYLVPFWLIVLFAYFLSGIVLSLISFIWYLVLVNFMYYHVWNSLASFNLLSYIVFTFLFLFLFLYIHDRDRIYFLMNELNLNFFAGIILFIAGYFLLMYYMGFIDNFFISFSFSLASFVISFVICYFAVLILGIGIGDIGIGRIRWLLDLNNPILSDLSKLAPGTFNHSLRVSELSEACAKAIGANPILVKIGALYHDIGKMLRPKYFTENLVQGEKNPHDDKEPYLSASIIKSHVIDGLKLAQKYNLPSIIQEFIKTHHGTTTILYFFIKARNLQNTTKKYPFEIREEDFKYPGPKPYTKEMLILMICDSVEAASRSLSEYSYSAIEKLTDNIINRLIQEKQFSDVDITFKEINTIKDTLVKNLYISYHVRLKYPSYAGKNNNQ